MLFAFANAHGSTLFAAITALFLTATACTSYNRASAPEGIVIFFSTAAVYVLPFLIAAGRRTQHVDAFRRFCGGDSGSFAGLHRRAECGLAVRFAHLVAPRISRAGYFFRYVLMPLWGDNSTS